MYLQLHCTMIQLCSKKSAKIIVNFLHVLPKNRSGYVQHAYYNYLNQLSSFSQNTFAFIFSQNITNCHKKSPQSLYAAQFFMIGRAKKRVTYFTQKSLYIIHICWFATFGKTKNLKMLNLPLLFEFLKFKISEFIMWQTIIVVFSLDFGTTLIALYLPR